MEEGKRFSLGYLERTDPVRDSIRFRNRLAAYYQEHLKEDYRTPIRNIIVQETGAEVPWITNFGWDVGGFFKENALRDVLDSITLIYQTLTNDLVIGGRFNSTKSRLAKGWKDFVTRALIEENLGYRLDLKCGVHYYVDEEFERNRFSTLTILDDKIYANVKANYEDAYKHFDSDPIDTKAAVRSMFESLEILVKQMVSVKNLGKYSIENALKPKCISLYNDDPTAEKVVSELFDGFGLWVDGLHNYRHGQAEESPVVPPEDVTIYILSSGSAFLRWLVGLNNRMRNEES